MIQTWLIFMIPVQLSPYLKIINSFMCRSCNTLTIVLNVNSNMHGRLSEISPWILKKIHTIALPPNDLKAQLLNQDMSKGQGQVIEHWIERLILRIFCAHHILTMCPPLAGWECSRGFISKLLQGFIGKKFGGWQHSFCQWYLFYFSHCFQHPHIAVHLRRVGPMPMTPSLNLSFYCGESYSTTDTKATSSSTALNLAWPSFHPGFVSYTTCHIPCSATLLSLGMRRKVPCHAGSGRLPIPHTFCYSTCNCLKC